MNIQSYQNRLDMLVNCNIYNSISHSLNEIVKMDDIECIKNELGILLEETKYTYIEFEIISLIKNNDITKDEIVDTLKNYRYKSLYSFIRLYKESIFN